MSTVIVPNADAASDANDGNICPFSIANFGGSAPASMRYQQIYAASQFSQAGTITAISFRIDSASGNNTTFSNVSFDVKFNLAYSANAPASASTTFASNVGSNNTTVLDGVFSKGATGGSNPNPFDFTFNFTTTFFYDPGNGPLLVDIFMRNCPASRTFDADNSPPGNCVARILTSVPSGTVNDSTGSTTVYGLVTQFTYTIFVAPRSVRFLKTPTTIRVGGSLFGTC